MSALPETDQSRFAEALYRKIVDCRGEFEVVSAGTVRHRLGAEAYADMLEEYRLAAELSAERLVALRDIESIARYLVLARIEGNEVAHNTSSVDGHGGDDGYRIHSISTSRVATVSMRIYDLSTGMSIWSGATNEGRNNSKEVDRTRIREDEEEDFWVRIVDEVFEDDDPEYPPTPGFDSTLFKCFYRLAQSLPEPPED